MNGNTGWRTLAEPTYGITDERAAIQLPAGTTLNILSTVEDDGSVEVAAYRPDLRDDDPGPEYVTVTASALRFEDTFDQFLADCVADCVEARSLGERLGFQPVQSRTHGYNGQEHR